MSEIQKTKNVTLQALEGVTSQLHNAILEQLGLDVHPELIDFLVGKLYHQLAIDVLATCANIAREAAPSNQQQHQDVVAAQNVVTGTVRFVGRGKPKEYPLTNEDDAS